MACLMQQYFIHHNDKLQALSRNEGFFNDLVSIGLYNKLFTPSINVYEIVRYYVGLHMKELTVSRPSVKTCKHFKEIYSSM